MTSSPDLEGWNHQALMLVQALLGAVSPNFRMVVLDHEGTRWKLSFVLEKDQAEDRAEIEDIASEFATLQDKRIDFETEVNVAAGALPWPSPPARVLFRRREP